MTKLLPPDMSFEGPFPQLSRRLRLGVVGGGRISVTQAMAARMTDCWEVTAGALSSDPREGKGATQGLASAGGALLHIFRGDGRPGKPA